MQNDWYRSFFHGVWLDVWRGVMTPEMTEADASFLETALRLEPGGLVLDVACGAGRHSLALARRGYAPTGIDLSEQSIAEARGAAARSPVCARNGDRRRIPAPETPGVLLDAGGRHPVSRCAALQRTRKPPRYRIHLRSPRRSGHAASLEPHLHSGRSPPPLRRGGPGNRIDPRIGRWRAVPGGFRVLDSGGGKIVSVICVN